MASLGYLTGPWLADRRPPRSLHHARSRLGGTGAPSRVRRQSLLCLVRRANHLHCGNEGMVGRQAIRARLAKLVVAAPGRAVLAVSGQGQRALSYRELPCHLVRQRRTLEIGRRDQGLSLVDL